MARDLLTMLMSSDTFEGVTFRGSYTIETLILEKIFNHYKETGENALDAYSACVYLQWYDIDDYDTLLDEAEYNELYEKIDMIEKLGLFPVLEIKEFKEKADIQHKNWLEWVGITSIRQGGYE